MRASAYFLLAAALSCLPSVAQAQQECTGLFVNPPESTQCTYEHVGFGSFSYVNGSLRATWHPDLQLIEVHISSDWQDLGAYTSGNVVVLPIDSSRSRYDFVGKAMRISTGETLKFLTPIVCVSGGVRSPLPAPIEGCFSPYSGCDVTATVNCPNSVTQTCSCSGDIDTCSTSCSTAGMACCTASERKQKIDSGTGAHIYTTISTRCENVCPPVPDPSPSPSPHP